MALIKLGELINQSDSRNENGTYGEEAVVGISTAKELIRTKADLNGVSLLSYKLLFPGYFAYVPDTSRRGDKIALAYNKSNETYLISSIYTVFSVDGTEKLLPDYLFIYFNRPEFDRYSRYNSWGSAREVFSWNDFCDIEVDLPDIRVQQKFVAIYNSILSNQKNYDQGLSDLQSTYAALIDKIKHSSKKIPVGDILIEKDVRNESGSINNVQGINITKQFMPSVADINGIDLSKYKVVTKGQFAFSGMQTGRDVCIRIALYNGEAPIIISPAYNVFEVKDHRVIPEYFMMWFTRSESDRHGWFMSDSSVRSNLDLDRFYETMIPVPDEGTQKAIVDIYRTYADRRKINEQLKSLVKDICQILIRGSLQYGG